MRGSRQYAGNCSNYRYLVRCIFVTNIESETINFVFSGVSAGLLLPNIMVCQLLIIFVAH